MSSHAAMSGREGVAAGCVVVAVPHGGLCEGIRDLLGTCFESVVLVADPESLATCVAALRPRLVVLDLAVAPREGMTLAARVRAAYPEVPILVLVNDDDEGFVRAARESGASGCLMLPALGQELLPAVEEILAGGSAFWSSHPRDGRGPESHRATAG